MADFLNTLTKMPPEVLFIMLLGMTIVAVALVHLGQSMWSDYMKLKRDHTPAAVERARQEGLSKQLEIIKRMPQSIQMDALNVLQRAQEEEK